MNSIRILIVMIALMFGAVSGAWAQLTNSDVKIEVKPSTSAGEVTVSTIETREVTLTVTPAANYYIKASDIIVEKLVNLDKANARGRRTPAIADLITGKMYKEDGTTEISSVEYGSTAKYVFTLPANYDGAYVTATFNSLTEGNIIRITASTDLRDNPEMMAKHYIVVEDISASVVANLYSETAFTGTFEADIDPETKMPYRISGLSAPLFNTLTGTVKNLVLEDVGISGNTGNTGAIACTANGAARIYNVGILSGSVGGTGDTGGLVGDLNGTARVINCYSFANITGGTNVGGIVGNNKETTNSDNANLKTMVMNCMFYGDITGGNTKSPIYGGTIISNAGNKGVGNYNYFRLEAPYVQPTGIIYNCALGAEDRYLQRFEFYRHLLNSHRELAGWWATGTFSSSEMLKWVFEPSQIGSETPYPILKTSGKYPSVVNIDAENATTQSERNKGGKLGTLTVNIQMGDGAVFPRPTGAAITTTQLTLNITDKDPDHFNFNYYKVQLPYYNDVGTKNYNGNRVVTGWKIVSITGGTPGTFTASDSWGGYNFADRNCTNKDLYGTDGSNRIFNQGAYWDVPEGVTAITIEPYWAKCVYLADANADKVYSQDMKTGYDVPNVGGGNIYTNGNSYSIAGENQVVYTTMGNAIASSGTALFQGVDANNHSVYDYAVVLVGNYHHYNSIEASRAKPYTVTSIDLDGDNEPDYSYILRFDSRTETHPVRTDFINIPGLGMAQKSTGGKGSYNFGILIPKGWFESTNTSLLRFTQFEYENAARIETDALILQGGVVEQWVSYNQKGRSNKIPYIHVGGNVWFKEFHTGCHQDKNKTSGNLRFQPTKHSPISVTGGDFDKFYLTGLYVANAGLNNYEDNAECYINGGRFGTVCGAAMEGIGKANGADDTGNITWLIQNADIHEFYAGGLNAAKPVTGNLSTTIVDSNVDIFCGGPKFGDMSANKTVVTNATGCTFGSYFGAGYGGNSYNRYAPINRNNVINLPGRGKIGDGSEQDLNSWNDWASEEYTQTYNDTYKGVSTQIDYQFLPMSSNVDNVARLWVEFVNFSLATCHNVTSSLTGCTVTGNFYGGGNLGKVAGNVTSTLTDCTVNGSVYGAGYSASIPTVEVMDIGFATEPYYYEDLGTYRTGVFPTTTTYTWVHRDQVTNTATAINKTDHILYTTENLTQLGTVTGNVTLTIDGTTTVDESVFGGGESSNVGDVDSSDESSTTVNVISGTVTHDVYGGGALANVVGNTKVNLIGGTVTRNVYGGGMGRLEVVGSPAVGTVGEDGYVPAVEAVTPIAATVGSTTVNLNGIDAADYIADYTTLAREGDSGPYTVGDDQKGCVIGGDIFGCNNLNGTPLGSVTVHVYATQNAAATRIANPAEGEKTAKVEGRYDVQHVYGGGNLAAYEPTNNTNTTVIIDGCDRTSIYQVYGGGNAASTPATRVDINGTFEIEEAFGGGNGKDDIVINGETKPNPGANVGFKDYSSVESTYPTKEDRQKADFISAYTYGTGEAKMNIHGGKIHRVYGGSNTKGNVRISAVTMLEEVSDCPFDVDEAYGGGKSAPMDGASNLVMACIPGLKAAYGGAEDANIEGDVDLNITNGYFDRVFGGNNVSGRIGGTITVNIEETGCKPIVIGQLYGGGNLAPYTAPSGQHGPTLNVRSFTSIGEVYGGGYGSTAIVTGDTYVNINVCDGMNYSNNESLVSAVADEIAKRATITFTEYEIENGQLKLDNDGNRIPVEKTVSLTMPTRAGLMGAIHNVFGGGNAANVVGSTHVNIGTTSTEVFVTPMTKVVNGITVETTDEERTNLVSGADIRGNVYGGGNAAEVTGDTNVVIGKETTTP